MTKVKKLHRSICQLYKSAEHIIENAESLESSNDRVF